MPKASAASWVTRSGRYGRRCERIRRGWGARGYPQPRAGSRRGHRPPVRRDRTRWSPASRCLRRNHMLGPGVHTRRRRQRPERSLSRSRARARVAQGVAPLTETRRHFARRVNQALEDPKLQRALIQAMTGLRTPRNSAFESFDFAMGRANLKARRQANLDRLPGLVQQFTERLEAVGGKVHFARDAAAARDIIAEICADARSHSDITARQRMVVTKVKSMASEEI